VFDTDIVNKIVMDKKKTRDMTIDGFVRQQAAAKKAKQRASSGSF